MDKTDRRSKIKEQMKVTKRKILCNLLESGECKSCGEKFGEYNLYDLDKCEIMKLKPLDAAMKVFDHLEKFHPKAKIEIDIMSMIKNKK